MKPVKKIDILNYSFEDLILYLDSVGEKTFRATQIFEWIYQKGVRSFDEMRNLPKDLRTRLSQEFILKPLRILKKQTSKDGTAKVLFTRL